MMDMQNLPDIILAEIFGEEAAREFKKHVTDGNVAPAVQIIWRESNRWIPKWKQINKIIQTLSEFSYITDHLIDTSQRLNLKRDLAKFQERKTSLDGLWEKITKLLEDFLKEQRWNSGRIIVLEKELELEKKRLSNLVEKLTKKCDEINKTITACSDRKKRGLRYAFMFACGTVTAVIILANVPAFMGSTYLSWVFSGASLLEGGGSVWNLGTAFVNHLQVCECRDVLCQTEELKEKVKDLLFSLENAEERLENGNLYIKERLENGNLYTKEDALKDIQSLLTRIYEDRNQLSKISV